MRDKLRPVAREVNNGTSAIVEWLLSAGDTFCGFLEKSVGDTNRPMVKSALNYSIYYVEFHR